jgi:hypothetical protein
MTWRTYALPDPNLEDEMSSHLPRLVFVALLLGCGSSAVVGTTAVPPRDEASNRTAAAPLGVCAPRAVPQVPTAVALPEGLLHACRLTASSQDRDADGAPEVVIEYAQEGRFIRARQRRAGDDDPGFVFTELELGENGRLVSHRSYRAAGELSSETSWTFDGDGRLSSERSQHRSYGYYDGGERLRRHTVRQTWNEGRLTSRTTEEDGEMLERIAWSYDAQGRLVLAERFDSTSPHRAVARARWSYDEAGRPSGLVREHQGAVVLSAVWRYDAAGLVRSRTLSLPRGVAPVFGIDDYDVWDTSATTAHAARASEECARLPIAVAHGYPDSEADYTLAFADMTGDESLGYVYASAVGYYSYSPARAFGHHGVVGNFDGYAREIPAQGALHVETEYDAAGRLTYEQGDGVMRWERTRAFAHEGLAHDVLVSYAEDVAETRALLFSRDEAGRMIGRDLLGTAGVLASHRWAYDDRERSVAHAFDLGASVSSAGSGRIRGRVARRTDTNGRVVREEVIVDEAEPRQRYGGAPQTGSVFVRERAYDANGRLSESLVTQAGTRSRERTRYDDAGHIVWNESAYAHGDDVWRGIHTVATDYNAAGLPTRRETRLEGAYGGNHTIETLSYACE